jgi:hypothetical protein
LFSSNGILTNDLLDPRRAVEREYVATVDGDALQPDLKARLEEGVQTSLGIFAADLLEQKDNTVRLVVTEGKYRMVRRILANVGLPVTALHRVRYGVISLNDLKIGEGEHCEVSPEATEWAEKLISKKTVRKHRTREERLFDEKFERWKPTPEPGFNPTLSKYSPSLVVAQRMTQEEKDMVPTVKSYTLKENDWDLTPEEEADVLDESKWKVYEPSFFDKPDPKIPVPKGPVEV